VCRISASSCCDGLRRVATGCDDPFDWPVLHTDPFDWSVLHTDPFNWSVLHTDPFNWSVLHTDQFNVLIVSLLSHRRIMGAETSTPYQQLSTCQTEQEHNIECLCAAFGIKNEADDWHRVYPKRLWRTRSHRRYRHTLHNQARGVFFSMGLMNFDVRQIAPPTLEQSRRRRCLSGKATQNRKRRHVLSPCH